MNTRQDLIRELAKALDVLEAVNTALDHETRMNAAKDMTSNVRPTPLAAAVDQVCANLRIVLEDVNE